MVFVGVCVCDVYACMYVGMRTCVCPRMRVGVYPPSTTPICPPHAQTQKCSCSHPTPFRRPEPSYEGNYNFFDPDCFLTVSALVHSGVEYLHKEVRLMLERTVQDVRSDGLMPHHLKTEGVFACCVHSPSPPLPFYLLSASCAFSQSLVYIVGRMA